MTLMPALRKRLLSIVGDDGFFDDPVHRHVYEADAYAFDAGAPDAVVLPRSAEEVQRVVRCCIESGISFAPRGSGTGLSAGCVAGEGSIQIGLARMRRILRVDPLARRAVVEAGVINQELSDEAARHGLEFAPDPSSQIACTVGGNFAENAGGPHTLKYGVTFPHIVAARIVDPQTAEDRLVSAQAELGRNKQDRLLIRRVEIARRVLENSRYYDEANATKANADGGDGEVARELSLSSRSLSLPFSFFSFSLV